jgi:hypothetical protein
MKGSKMRNLALFSLLMSVAMIVSLVGSPTQCLVAQEQPTVGDTDLNFNVGGAEFDPEAQRAAEAAGAAAGIISTFILLIQLAIAVVVIVSLWKVFVKAGKPGWAAIIPIYNVIVLLEICGRPIWWVILLLVPCVNIVVAVFVMIDLAKSFGKDALFGIGLWLLGFIFFPILGFGSSQYQGPAAAA